MQTQTTTIKLALPNSTYGLIAARAKAEGIDPAHYCSILLTNSVVNDTENAPPNPPLQIHAPNGLETIAVTRKLPSTIEQILSVCRNVWRGKMEFGDALRKVAKEFNREETTVRDKCTRRISLPPHTQIDTGKFIEMLAQPITLRNYLCRRFPKYAAEISHRFESITPQNLGVN